MRGTRRTWPLLLLFALLLLAGATAGISRVLGEGTLSESAPDWFGSRPGTLARLADTGETVLFESLVSPTEAKLADGVLKMAQSDAQTMLDVPGAGPTRLAGRIERPHARDASWNFRFSVPSASPLTPYDPRTD